MSLFTAKTTTEIAELPSFYVKGLDQGPRQETRTEVTPCHRLQKITSTAFFLLSSFFCAQAILSDEESLIAKLGLTMGTIGVVCELLDLGPTPLIAVKYWKETAQ